MLGLMATCNYINDPKASRKGIFFILSASSGVEGQSSVEITRPGRRGVIVGKQRCILNHLRRHLQYACYDRVTSPFWFLSMHIPRISLALPRSLIS